MILAFTILCSVGLSLAARAQVLNTSPVVKLTYPSPAAEHYISYGWYTRLSAEAFDPDGAITEVRFYGKGTRFPGSASVLLGVATNAPFAVVWRAAYPPDGGTFWSFYAVAKDNSGAESASGGVLQYVEREGLGHAFLQPQDGTMVAAGTNFWFGAELTAALFRGDIYPIDLRFDRQSYSRTFPPITNVNPAVSVLIANIAEGEHLIETSWHPQLPNRIYAVKVGMREPVLTWDGKLEFELVTAYPGRETVIESSTNLAEWAAFRTVTPETNYVRITVAPEDAKRWFRARVEEGGP